MSITLEKVKTRIYFSGNTFPLKDKIKSLGGHWDGDWKQWWIGVKKQAEAERLISAPSDAIRAAAESVGLREDTPAGIVLDKVREEQGEAVADAILRPRQDPHDIRLTGKGRYKGREYYAGSITKDGTKVRLLTLPDAKGDYLDFWAPCVDVEEIKRYEPREKWDGRRNSGRTILVYTTLGSIADFIARQRNPDTARGECTECGHWGPKGETCEECHEGTHV